LRINDKTIDWRAEWVARWELRGDESDSAMWDARAEDHARRKDMSEYALQFIGRLEPAQGASVFDMGSGAGTLAIPLARMGCRVVCGDFSAGMREALAGRAEAEGLADLITLRDVRWDDDWEAAGIAPGSVDIAVASRSVIARDVGAALAKLEAVARERVAITVSTRFGPRGVREVGEELCGAPYLPDFVYVMNVLFDMGRYPSLSFIDAHKGGERRLVRWAFISWDVPA
jgi:SAM-dependent methyltransferase